MDSELRTVFERAGVGAEPPIGSLVSDSLHAGHTRRRRRRLASVTGGLAAVALVAAGVPVAIGAFDHAAPARTTSSAAAAPAVTPATTGLVPVTPQALAKLLIELRPSGYTSISDSRVPLATLDDRPTGDAVAVITVTHGASLGTVSVDLTRPGSPGITPCAQLVQPHVVSCQDTTVGGTVTEQRLTVAGVAGGGLIRHVSALHPDGVVVDVFATNYPMSADHPHVTGPVVMSDAQLHAAATDRRWAWQMDASFVAGAATLHIAGAIDG